MKVNVIQYIYNIYLEFYINQKVNKDSRISGSHGGEYEDGCLLGCSVV
jgi:hypothetical protein